MTFYQRNGFYDISHIPPPHIQKLSKEINNRCEKEAEILYDKNTKSYLLSAYCMIVSVLNILLALFYANHTVNI